VRSSSRQKHTSQSLWNIKRQKYETLVYARYSVHQISLGRSWHSSLFFLLPHLYIGKEKQPVKTYIFNSIRSIWIENMLRTKYDVILDLPYITISSSIYIHYRLLHLRLYVLDYLTTIYSTKVNVKFKVTRGCLSSRCNKLQAAKPY